MGEVVALALDGAIDGAAPAGVRQATEPARPTEAERLRRRLKRAAFDVHDGPMQELIGICWRLQSARGQAVKATKRGDDGALAAMLDECVADLAEVEKGLRLLMLSLEHETVPREASPVPVEDIVAAFRKCTSATVEVDITGNVAPRTDSQRIVLERVLRESLSNIAKHSDAQHVAVSLHGTDESIVLEIRDDGCGFTPNAPRAAEHVGLRAMRELIRLLGGHFNIESRKGGPTTVTAVILKWQHPSEQGRV